MSAGAKDILSEAADIMIEGDHAADMAPVCNALWDSYRHLPAIAHRDNDP